jgi:hypothetical protein
MVIVIVMVLLQLQHLLHKQRDVAAVEQPETGLLSRHRDATLNSQFVCGTLSPELRKA